MAVEEDVRKKVQKLTSIIIPSYNQWQYTKQCLESVRQFTDVPYELIVIANGSQDESVQELRRMDDVILIENEVNQGFPRACNQGMEQAQGEHLLILCNDIVVSPHWLSNLLQCLYSHPSNGAVGPLTNYVSGVQIRREANYSSLDEYYEFAKESNRSDPAKWFYTLRLVGFCLLIRRDVYERVGGFDERFGKGNFEDDDYCMRIRRTGYRLVVAGDAFVHHYGSVTLRTDPEYSQLLQTNRQKFIEKWGIEPEQTLQLYEDIASFLPPCERVLDSACGVGGLGLTLKNKGVHFVAGIESNELLAIDARTVLDEVWIGNVGTIRLPYPDEWFDALVLADTLGDFANPATVLTHIMTYLKQGGYVIASISNAAYAGLIQKLLAGESRVGAEINRNIGFFTLGEIAQIFAQAGLQIDCIGTVQEADEHIDILVHELLQLRTQLGFQELFPSAEDQLKTIKYYIRASKQ